MAKKQKQARIDLKELDLKGIVKALNTRYGEGTLVIATKALGTIVEFVSTGCAALDFALGGGFPKNRITEIRGPFSALKTTLGLLGIANFQALHPDDGIAIFVDVEKALDVEYAIKLGVDPDRMLIVNPDSGEQGVDVIADLMGTSYHVFMVVDSIAALVPTAEIEASMDQQFQGLHPRLINRMMRLATARLKRSLYNRKAATTTIIALNQIREKIGVIYGNPETTPGGRGKDFFYSVMIRLSAAPSGRIVEEVTHNGVTRRILMGLTVSFSINKNKTGGSQYEDGEFQYYRRPYKHYEAHTFNNDETLLNMGLFYDFIKPIKIGKKTRLELPGGKTIPAKTGAALRALVKLEKAKKKLYKRILKRVIEENRSGITSSEAEDAEKSVEVEIA